MIAVFHINQCTGRSFVKFYQYFFTVPQPIPRGYIGLAYVLCFTVTYLAVQVAVLSILIFGSPVPISL